MSRYLGIDYGSKRIGVAVGESTSRIASPVATVEGKPRLADQLDVVLRYAAEYGVDAFVVGLPLNMDDSEGPQAKVTRAFGDELAKRSGQPVHYFDERLSSAAADELLEPAQLSRKKRRVRQDRVAAQVILQAFLETL
jgi:putative Holliday junction resolvase